MALQTKTISSTATANGYTLHLELTENSVSAADNTSSVSWRLYLTSGGWSFSQYRVGWSVSLNGTVVGSRSKSGAPQVSIGKNSELTVKSGTATVPHGADGSLNMAAAASIDMDAVSYTPGPMSLSGSMALTNIPRASTLSASNGTLGTAQTLTVNRASAGFTHTLTYDCGSAGGTILSNSAAASVSWTPPLSLAAQNTTGQTVSVAFTLTTFNGSATVGTTTKTVSMAIPSSVKPTASAAVAVVNDNATVNGWGVAVKGFSRYKVTTSFTGAQGSTLKSRSVTVNGTGQTLTTSPATSSVLSSTTRTVKVKVTDSRDRAGDTVTVNGPMIYDYGSPTLSAATAWRCVSGGTASDSGTYLYVKCTGAVSSCGGHNGKTVQYRRRVAGGSWTGWAALTSGTAQTVNAGLDPSRSYEVQFRVSDSLGGERSVTVTVPTAAVTLHLRAGGKGAAFGGYAQRDSAVDFTDWDVVGRVAGLGYCPALPEGSDLNACTTPGVFAVKGDAAAATMSNCPSVYGGRLTVVSAMGDRFASGDAWQYYRQIYESRLGYVYQRRGDSGSAAQVIWGDWMLVYGADAVVDSGKSGNWNYMKYASGNAIMWGIHPVSPTSSNAVGSCYYTEELEVAPPFSLITAAVTGTVDVRSLLVTNAYYSSSSNVLRFRLLRPAAIPTSTTYNVRLQVWARWK